MAISIDERKERARIFRMKSDMAYACAQDELAKNRYRNVCNRAWYALMQIITAATYEDMNDEPSLDRPNWSHERQSLMFRNFVRKHKVWEEYKALVTETDLARERRNDADYIAPNEKYDNMTDAERSFKTATNVRDVVFSLIGNKWDGHKQPDLTKDGTIDD